MKKQQSVRISKSNNQDLNTITQENLICEVEKSCKDFTKNFHKQGFVTTHSDIDGIYSLFPNGTKRYIKYWENQNER